MVKPCLRPQPGAIARAAISLAVLLVALGCTETPPQRPLPTAVTAPSREPPPAATSSQPTPLPLSPLTLVWWTPEFLSPSATQPAGPEIKRQLDQFTTAQQGKIRVEPVLKARYGNGGLLDYLLSAQHVAPSVLPDIVALDVAELQGAVDAGLLQTLDGLLDVDLVDGLYPFAIRAGQYDGRPLAVQWMADLEHAGALPDQSWPELPQWDTLLTDGAPYLFALGTTQAGSSQSASVGLSSAALGHYLSAGGSMDAEDRELTLDAAPLRRMLTFYRDADQAGILPPNALELADSDAVWSVFAQGQIPRAQVSARRFYNERGDAGNPAFSRTPGWQEAAPPVASGWALAIVTPDPVRQEAAAQLISWLLEAPHAGAAAAAVNWLPTSPGALAIWPPSPYTEFLDELLATASPLPAGKGYPQIAARIHQAIISVIEDDTRVDAAIEEALQAQ
jgi:ABC-type glycerol-3-phosphate transport system substrate-binding protein